MAHDTKYLVVIADGEHAKFATVDPAGVLRPVTAMDSAAAHKRSVDLGSDHPGAAYHSDSTAHHAMQPRHDPHDRAEVDFAHLVAAEIATAFARGDFNRLVLAAPSHTLNAIRDRLGGEVSRTIVGTLGKDLVKLPDEDVALHLRQWLVPQA